MNLSPMRFKHFIWPHNPKVYAITFERKMAVHKVPFGRHHLQSLGQTRRVLKGEGEFVGEGAYDTFKQLATVFYEESPGVLMHPVWMTTTAWFVGLELKQEPRPDYVRYTFEFWEVVERDTTAITEGAAITPITASAEGERLFHTVVKGDTLWALARQYDTTVERLVELNPAISNPNRIYPGQEVRVR